jgi:hypothetical protein
MRAIMAHWTLPDVQGLGKVVVNIANRCSGPPPGPSPGNDHELLNDVTGP